MRFARNAFLVLLFLGLVGGSVGVGVVAWAFWHYGKGLPDYKQLADYEPPTSTRVHAGDGHLLAEFAMENRVFVPIEAMPIRVIQGFIAAEDQHFYDHFGIDLQALFRAAVTDVVNVVQGRRLIGASTITQQVARNFLLTNEFSLERKIKEAILALRIERALSKDRILELYLNEIFLGYRSYGVAAAALNYFDKSLDELTVAEIAYLAALPKAPNNYHPIRRHEAALARRNWVIDRMLEERFITAEEAAIAKASPLGVKDHADEAYVDAGYFLEEVRRDLEDRFGVAGLYEGGLSVRTTLDPVLQDFARRALRDGLMAYDRRHGYRGPVGRIGKDAPWYPTLTAFKAPPGALDWQPAAVLSVEKNAARIGLRDRTAGTIPLAAVKWARRPNGDAWRTVGPAIRSVGDVLSVGDIVLVEKITEGPPPRDGEPPVRYPDGTYALRQIPEVNGAIVAMDPHTGRVLAMSGGWSFEASQFNRATQAYRQPGSAFKPFVYLTALQNGFTPATTILDAPFVIDQGKGLGKWKPSNFSRTFFGPSPMRIGIEKSRNLMTVRLAQAVGMEKVARTAARFGIKEDMPPRLVMALGAADVRLIDMVTAYSALVNGGKKVVPTLIDRIQNRQGRTVFRHDQRSCPNCNPPFWDHQPVPKMPDPRPQITDPASAYQIVSMLEGAVQRGTGRRVAQPGRPLGGKTGTSNESRDAWFIGFSPDLAVGVFVGFDTPIPLGRRPWGGQEQGASVAAPIFKEFMQRALADKPAIPFRTPPDIRMVRIDAKTGKRASSSSGKVIVEAFKAGTEPKATGDAVFISGNDGPIPPASGGGTVAIPMTEQRGRGAGGVPIAPSSLDAAASDAPGGLY